MKQLSLFLVMSLSLIGCGEKIYSVEEFMNDRQLIRKYLKKCSDEQRVYLSKNCENLTKALLHPDTKLFLDSYEEFLSEYNLEKNKREKSCFMYK